MISGGIEAHQFAQIRLTSEAKFGSFTPISSRFFKVQEILYPENIVMTRNIAVTHKNLLHLYLQKKDTIIWELQHQLKSFALVVTCWYRIVDSTHYRIISTTRPSEVISVKNLGVSTTSLVYYRFTLQTLLLTLAWNNQSKRGLAHCPNLFFSMIQKSGICTYTF